MEKKLDRIKKMEKERHLHQNGERYLNFLINGENYCFEILKIKELMGMTAITPVPRCEEYIRGVINLRGAIIPVIDLRIKFGLPEISYTKKTSIIICEITLEEEKSLMGIIVDSIKEVINVPHDQISPINYLKTKIDSEFILGVANTSDGIKTILSADKICDNSVLKRIHETIAS